MKERLAVLFLLLSAVAGCCSWNPWHQKESAGRALYDVLVRGRIGFIDRRGRVVVSPQFLHCGGRFSQGLCPVAVEPGQFGYIGHSGRIVIPPRYEFADEFHEGLAFVRIRGKHGVIDVTGELVVPATFERIPGHSGFSEGLAPAGTADKYGFINTSGEWVIPPKFDSAQSFSEGAAAVSIGQQEGYVNAEGDWLAGGPRFQSAAAFSEGLAEVRVKDGVGYINRQGRFVIRSRFGRGYSFHEGLARVRLKPAGKWRYIRPDGTFAFPESYESCGDFHEGLAYVETEEGFGFIDKQGRLVIPPRFAWAGSFRNGLAPAGDRSGSHPRGVTAGYIGRQGRYVWEPRPLYPPNPNPTSVRKW